MFRQQALCFALAIAISSAGCAVFNRDNTPTLNFVESHIFPKSEPAQTLSYPVMIPLGLVAVSVDGLLIHPVVVVDDAYEDTIELFWEHREWQDEYVTECTFLLPRTALSIVFFSLDYLGRSMFYGPESGTSITTPDDTVVPPLRPGATE